VTVMQGMNPEQVRELSRSLSRQAHRLEVREAYGMSHEVHVYDVGPLHVFGATARILTQLLGAWRSE